MIAIDQGRSAIKILHTAGRTEWPPLLARLDRPPQAALLDSTGSGQGTVVFLDDGWYAVGEAARGLREAVHVTDERKATPAARVILAAALTSAGADRWDKVPVAMAVPAGLMSSDSWPLARSMAGPLSIALPLGNTRTVYVDPHVLAEPAAAALSVVLDANGCPDRGLLEKAIAVADLGHRTLDIAVLHRGRVVDGSSRSTPAGGVLAYERWTREILEPTVGLMTDSERAVVVSEVAAGRAPVLRGREVPASALARLEEYRRWLSERVVADLRNALAAVEYDVLLLTGGLSGWLEPELRDAYPHARIPPEPRWAVGEGGLRYLRYLARRRATESLAQAAT
jgi:hypothetical protein